MPKMRELKMLAGRITRMMGRRMLFHNESLLRRPRKRVRSLRYERLIERVS